VQKPNPLQDKWRNVVFFLTALLVLVADQSSKIWIRSVLDDNEVLFKAGFFRIINIHNTGAAFGIFPDQKLALIIVAIVCIVVLLLFIFLYSHRFPFLNNKLGMLTLGLIFGGIAGNLIDRVRLGYVTDFIDIGIWPAFNVADSSSTVGGILFICLLLFLVKGERRKYTDQNGEFEKQS